MSDLSYGEVEAWLKARRDVCSDARSYNERAEHSWWALDGALDDFRAHAVTGTPLGQPVRQHEEQG